jgi:hypothetical protein
LVGFSTVLVLGIVAWYETDTHWITSGERASAKSVLVEIDKLQDSAQLSDGEFEARKAEAADNLRSAAEKAETRKDRQISKRLEYCLGGVGEERFDMKLAAKVSHGTFAGEQSAKGAAMMFAEFRRDTEPFRNALRELHRDLD